MTAFEPIALARRIALLIDGDNIRAENVPQALEKLAPLGNVAVRRAYGNWEQRKDVAAALQQHAVRAFHQPPLTDHKNGSDIALAVDAIDLLHTQQIDAFAILSNDADFTPLMLRLREAGCEVYGLGEEKAPSALRAACSIFFELAPSIPAALWKVIAACKATENRVPLTSVGTALKNAGVVREGTLNAFLRKHGIDLSDDNKYVIVR